MVSRIRLLLSFSLFTLLCASKCSSDARPKGEETRKTLQPLKVIEQKEKSTAEHEPPSLGEEERFSDEQADNEEYNGSPEPVDPLFTLDVNAALQQIQDNANAARQRIQDVADIHQFITEFTKKISPCLRLMNACTFESISADEMQQKIDQWQTEAYAQIAALELRFLNERTVNSPSVAQAKNKFAKSVQGIKDFVVELSKEAPA